MYIRNRYDKNGNQITDDMLGKIEYDAWLVEFLNGLKREGDFDENKIQNNS